MINTLGDVIMAALILAALIVVPYKIVKAWAWPKRRNVVMSRPAQEAIKKTDMEAIYIPVPDTNIKDGIDWQMPRISAYLSDDEFLVMLTRQKLRDGKWRLSANKVYEIIGGNRNDVLEVVRQIRATPDFSNRTADQEQARKELELA